MFTNNDQPITYDDAIEFFNGCIHVCANDGYVALAIEVIQRMKREEKANTFYRYISGLS